MIFQGEGPGPRWTPPPPPIWVRPCVAWLLRVSMFLPLGAKQSFRRNTNRVLNSRAWYWFKLFANVISSRDVMQNRLTLCLLLFFFFFFFPNLFLKKNFQEYHQSVKEFGSRSGLIFSRVWSGSKLFVKVISELKGLKVLGKYIHLWYSMFPLKREGASAY